MNAVLKAEVYEHKAYLTTANGEIISVFFVRDHQPIMIILTAEEVKDLEVIRRKYS